MHVLILGAGVVGLATAHALAADMGLTVLWATHLTDEVLPEDRLVVLHQGRVLADSTAAEVAGARPLTEAFLALTGAKA